MRYLRASLIALSLLAAPGLAPVLAQPTSTGTVSLQGKLTGVADGSQSLTFFLHDAQTGGTQVASVGPVSTQVTGGVFSASVPIPASTFDGRTLWWSVSVNGGAATARQLVTSVPNAATARSLDQGTAPNGQYFRRATDGMLESRGDIRFLDSAGSQLGAWSAAQISFSAAVNAPTLRFGGGGVRFDGQDTSYYMAAASSALEFGGFTLRFVSTSSTGGTIATWTAQSAYFNASLSTPTLTIRGGSDLAEPFAASPAKFQAVKPAPGMIMSIDPDHPGALRVATAAYDTKVAGVYSGANGLPTGMVMGKKGCDLTAPGDDKLPLAMTGRVWVYADETEGGGEIKPGDRLTTSGSKPGHAMKVREETRSIGAVIGKAMTNVDPKTGMVLVLVNLQ